MLKVILYHSIGEGPKAFSPLKLQQQLNELSSIGQIIVPGEGVKFFKQQFCLSFDDGYRNFYTQVFPLLKLLKIKVVLAVSTGLIVEKNFILPGEENLFCSWKELKEMHESGLVVIAAHGHNHLSLLKASDPIFEIEEPKKILKKQLNIEPEIFVYPFGHFNRRIHRETKKRYKYVFRIGSALNFSWRLQSLTYRVPVENQKNAFYHFISLMLNLVRGR